VAECRRRSRREEAARPEYERALDLARSARDATGVACAANRLGGLVHKSGDLAGAATLYDEALAQARRAERDDLVAFARNNQAGLLLQGGDLAAAGRALDEACATFARLGMESAVLTCRYNRGIVFIELGDAESARPLLEEFHRGCLERGEAGRADRAAATLVWLHTLAGDLPAARSWFSRVREDPEQVARADLHLGRALLNDGRYDEAAALLGRAADKVETRFTALFAEAFRAEAELRLGKLDEARRRLDRTVREADERGDVASAWIGRWLLGKVAIEEGRPAVAIPHLEEAVSLLARMGEGLDAGTEGLRFLRERSEPYADLAAALVPQGGARDRREVARILTVVEKAHARALRQLSGQAGSETVSLDALQKGLGPSEVVLDYLIGEDRGVVVAVGRDAVRAEVVDGWRSLRAPLLRHREALARPRAEACGTSASDGDEASELGRLLLAPVADLLAGARRVYVVPDRELASIPPATLPLPAGGWGEARYLGEVAETAVLPMAGVPPAWSEPRAPLLLAGDPFPDPSGDFPELPFAARELRGIADLWPDSERVVLQRDEFSPESWRELPLQRFHTLHLATHAIASTNDPARCAVILSRGASVGFDEVSRLSLGPCLVVLSACRTGEGEVVPGEGVIGLTWAFLRAGARGVAASLWRADDATTARLMLAFHAALREGRDPVEAMTLAQREVARRSPDPACWGAFTLVLRPES
jgi:CHAT domain-containing protein/predicted negative regulator of RcsB-dependent stress response